ncbi:hypothetical protein [uncultured Novosphingobium sp.]|uniref:hypothetical protein n=1 Tax=uncultured Novosphingobium sp. TaxID=292277 RepID=UPI0037499021
MRRDRRAGMLMLGLTVLTATPFALWSLCESGHVLPNTIGAKLAFFAQSQIDPVGRVKAVLVCLVASQLLPLFAGLAAAWHNTLTSICMVFIITILAVALATEPASLGWNEYRYLMTLIPILLFCCMQLTCGKQGHLLPLALLTWSIMLLPATLANLWNSEQKTAVELRALAHVAATIPPGTPVLVHDAGMIAWVAPQLRLIDVVGLKTPYSAAAHRRSTLASCGWDSALNDTAGHFHVQYMIVLQKPMWNCVASNLIRAGWSARALPYNSATSQYRAFAIQPFSETH